MSLGASRGEASTVESCQEAIRRMILLGELLPGEKVHQHDLAQRLQVSRIPLREALAALSAEGVLDHRRNSGYQVTRFNSADLAELYLMRRLLETELLRTAELGPPLAEKMRGINAELRGLDPRADLERYHGLNEAFHFAAFETSPLRLVREEVARLWYRTSIYRSFYLHQGRAGGVVVEEHEEMVEAAHRGDVEGLVAMSDAHRRRTEEILTSRLSPFPRP